MRGSGFQMCVGKRGVSAWAVEWAFGPLAAHIHVLRSLSAAPTSIPSMGLRRGSYPHCPLQANPQSLLCFFKTEGTFCLDA
jgi:hypothetical protein